jgi:hypothetical protein
MYIQPSARYRPTTPQNLSAFEQHLIVKIKVAFSSTPLAYHTLLKQHSQSIFYLWFIKTIRHFMRIKILKSVEFVSDDFS